MKLNLVPTNVSRERSSGGAIVVCVLFILAGIIGCVAMVVISGNRLQKSRSDEAESLQNAANTKAVSDQADALMATPKVNTLVRDVNLAQAMLDHNDVYPHLYDMVRNYVPGYYRVTSMAASPGDADTCVVTLSGVLTTYQQYADLGLALMRMPGAVSYSPSGYQITDKYVPPLTPEDMHGRPIRPGETNIPDDPLQRLQYYQNQGQLTTYLGQNGFGDADTTLKGPMPNASQVTISVTLKSDPLHHFSADIMTPDPRATLAAAASLATTSTASGGAAAGFGTPGAGGSTPPASAPPAPPAGAGSKTGKGKAGDDE